MKLNELKPSHAKMLSRKKWDRYTTIEHWLFNRGYERLGEGAFSVVFGKPDSNLAIKFTKLPDKGYRRFVNYSAEHYKTNPHLPKTSKIYANENEGEFVLFMERLEEFDSYDYDSEFEEQFLHSLAYWLDSGTEEQIKTNVKSILKRWYHDVNDEEYEKLWIKHKSLIDTTIKLKEIYSFLDLGTKNIMVRPSTNTLVITDPWAT